MCKDTRPVKPYMRDAYGSGQQCRQIDGSTESLEGCQCVTVLTASAICHKTLRSLLLLCVEPVGRVGDGEILEGQCRTWKSSEHGGGNPAESEVSVHIFRSISVYKSRQD